MAAALRWRWRSAGSCMALRNGEGMRGTRGAHVAGGGFLDEFGLEQEFVSKHVPELSKPQLQDKLRPALERFKQLGVDSKSLKSLLKKQPNVVRNYDASIEDNIRFLSAAGLDESQITAAASKEAAILLHSVPKVLQPKVTFLKHRGLDDQSLAAILSKSPGTMSLDPNDELAPRIDFLCHQCGIGPTYLAKTVVKNPSLLSYDVETRMKPILSQLKTKMESGSIRNLIVTCPMVFARDLEMIKELMVAFKYIGKDQKAMVESMAWGARYGIEAVRDKIDFLMSLDIPYATVAKMLKSEPYIFKVDNPLIKLKVEFLVKEMKFDVDELRMRPSYLTRKCMDRVRIRWEVLSLLKSRGIVNKIYFSDLLDLKRKSFVQTFVYKYPDCGRIYFGMRSQLKQARAAANPDAAASFKPSPF